MKFKLLRFVFLCVLFNVPLLSSQDSESDNDIGSTLDNDFEQQSDDSEQENDVGQNDNSESEIHSEQEEHLEQQVDFGLDDNFDNVLGNNVVDVDDKKEVVISFSLFRQLGQVFTHDGYHYKNIEYDDFYKNYPDVVNEFISRAHDESQLDEFEQFAEEPLFKICGEQPEFDDEPLFDYQKARDILINCVDAFIDKHEKGVHSKCVGHALQDNKSKVVWAAPCCGVQLHKNCFQQCRKGNVTKCMNSFCTKSDWTPEFYAAVFKKRRAIFFSQIYQTDCPICMEPLKIDKKKHKREADDCELGAHGEITTIGRKKAKH